MIHLLSTAVSRICAFATMSTVPLETAQEACPGLRTQAVAELCESRGTAVISEYEEHHTLPLVRPPGGRSGPLLHVGIQELEDPEGGPLWERRAGGARSPAGIGDDRRVR